MPKIDSRPVLNGHHIKFLFIPNHVIIVLYVSRKMAVNLLLNPESSMLLKYINVRT